MAENKNKAQQQEASASLQERARSEESAEARERQLAKAAGDQSGQVQVSPEPTDPLNAPQVRSPRQEEAEMADTTARETLRLERERVQQMEIELAQERARQIGVEAQRPIMVTDAVVRASLAAQAAAEAQANRLDRVERPLGAVYIVGGVSVNHNGEPV